MGKGDSNINYPAQPTYGEGMREALEAQVALLTGGEVGDADFRDVGPLEDLVREYEAPLRKTTAQIDTDVLRQTLLGSEQQTTQDPDTGKWGIAGTEVVKNDKGEPLESSEGRYQIIQTIPYREGFGGGPRGESSPTLFAQYSIIDTQTGGLQNVPGQAESGSWGSGPDTTNLKLVTSRFNDLQAELRASEEPESETVTTFTFSNPNIPADPDKAGQAGYDDMGRRLLRKGDTARTTTGMVDLVGDTRQVQQAIRSEDYASYVQDNPDITEQFAAARAGGDERTIEQFGKDHYEDFGRAEGREIKGTYAMEDAGRRAGFDETGAFLGLSAFGEDIQAGNLSRQRQRDLEDVARLSPLYSDIMDEYKPGTKEALEDARGVLKAREGAFTGAGGSLSDASTLARESILRIIGREPSGDELDTWTKQLQSGVSVEDMNAELAAVRSEYGDLPVMEGRLQAQARRMGRNTLSSLDTGSAITAPTGTAATGYDASTVAAPSALTAATRYDAATAAAIDPLAAATGYEARADLSSGRIGGDYEATRTISEETQTPLDFKNQGLMDAALRSYRESGGGSAAVRGVRVNNEEEFYNEMAKAYGVDVPYDTYSRGYTTGMTDRQSRGTGDIRAALMEDAYTGLGEGLTAREQEQIEQASRRRATALGRAFDRGSIADEVQSRVLEDRNRQAQNRAYAQQVLGQEAGLQTSDMSRNLQAQMQNQAAMNQAAQYGVGAGLQQEQAQAQFAQQKALSDQAAANRAAEYGIGAGLQQEQLGAQMAQQKAMADAQAANQAAQFGVGAGLQQQQFAAGQDVAAQAMNREAAMKGSEFDILQGVAREEQNIGRELAAAESDLDRDYRQRVSQEQLAQQGTLGYIDAATRLAALEDTTTLDPFQAVLNRAGGGSLAAGNQLLGTAQYGLQSGPQYLNPSSGLGFIQTQAANQANMFNAQQAAGATRDAGMMGMLGSLGGAAIGLCWVAREVYGAHNPAWLDFRQWMFSSAPRWFFTLYLTFGERFANFIKNKPRLKARIRMWMDSKIGR